MRFALDRYGSRGHFLFENQSFIDFPIGNERKREFRAAEMRFYLHKEFCAAGIMFLSTRLKFRIFRSANSAQDAESERIEVHVGSAAGAPKFPAPA